MTPLPCQLLVLAKEPLPGRVKTRLTPSLTPEQAAAVAGAALADTLAAVAATPVARRVLVLDGDASFPLPDDVDVLPQRGEDLAQRLAAAFEDAAATSDLPLLLVGMDTPQVTPALLETAVDALLAADAVLGLAADGGWWALGLQKADPRVFDAVPMSSSRTGEVQAARLDELGLATTRLPVLRDIDTPEDLAAVLAELPPTSRLAQLGVHA